MNLFEQIAEAAVAAVKERFDKDISPGEIRIDETTKEHEGDFTLLCFPLSRHRLGRPEEIAEAIGSYLKAHLDAIEEYNVIKGFLNLSLSDAWWLDFFRGINMPEYLRRKVGEGKKVVVEFSSPNTNKPLHLGHLRNNFLGFSICQILEANGYDVSRVCLVNDRGIAICKSMLMYQKYGAGATPQSTGKKPDHFVVDYYVRFGEEVSEQAEALIAGETFPNEEAKKKARKAKENDTALMQEAQAMLMAWEAGDPEVKALWKQLNEWVYQGFDKTYERLGIVFDKIFYESQTYLLGNNIVQEGLDSGVFFQKEDSSVWIDLTDQKLDEKVLRRSNGTSVYMTQDLGTAQARHDEFKMDKSIYVVGNEQDYHFQVLFAIMKKLGRDWADEMFHLSYGMVDLPDGKMKTREGTSVDADDLVEEVVATARAATEEIEKTRITDMPQAEQDQLFEMVGLAAIKYFLLRVQPKKRMVFNPAESVELHGNTGPFIQSSYTRCRSVLRSAAEKALDIKPEMAAEYKSLQAEEREILKQFFKYPALLEEAAEKYDPSLIANLAYEMAKNLNRLWHAQPILDQENLVATAFRLQLVEKLGELLNFMLDLLGIKVPERM